MQKILLASLVSAAFAMPAVAAEQADEMCIRDRCSNHPVKNFPIYK